MDVGTSAVAGRESGVIDKIFLPQIDHLIKRIGIRVRDHIITTAHKKGPPKKWAYLTVNQTGLTKWANVQASLQLLVFNFDDFKFNCTIWCLNMNSII